MAMFMLHLKCAVQYNPEVVWIFSSRLQYMCVARPQTTRTSKMILEKNHRYCYCTLEIYSIVQSYPEIVCIWPF